MLASWTNSLNTLAGVGILAFAADKTYDFCAGSSQQLNANIQCCRLGNESGHYCFAIRQRSISAFSGEVRSRGRARPLGA